MPEVPVSSAPIGAGRQVGRNAPPGALCTTCSTTLALNVLRWSEDSRNPELGINKKSPRSTHKTRGGDEVVALVGRVAGELVQLPSV